MKVFFLKLFLFQCLLLVIKTTSATGQFPDYLIENEDTFLLFSNPLEQYLNDKASRTINGIDLTMTSTACWRGYVATWKIQNDSLFLIEIKRRKNKTNQMTYEKFDLKSEFGKKIVFAEWFTGNIYSPRGNELQSSDLGYMSIYEKEKHFKLKNGIVKTRKQRNNLVYKTNRLYPAEKYLYDTLTRSIISRLDTNLVKEFSDKSSCFIYIKFNEKGEIESIENKPNYPEVSLMEKTLIETAKKALTEIPNLMKVKHKYYSPPYLQLFFNSYCIKNLWDKDYGCWY